MSKTPRVMTIFGTRPEAIKIAPVVKLLEKEEKLTSILVSTGQHRQMLDQVATMFGIDPDCDLEIMEPGQNLNKILTKTVAGVEASIERHAPDAIMVQGDTSTAMAAAIAAFNRGVKVVHLEAGLRTGDRKSPFPEEANRRIVAQITDLHLAPTHHARANLVREGFFPKDIVVTGNTVIDALQQAKSWDVKFTDHSLRGLVHSSNKIVMVTTHRRENVKFMAATGQAIRRLAQENPKVNFVLPAHLNPSVRAAILPQLVDLENVLVTDPLPYDEFVALMNLAFIVMTDSGGVQEEAPSLGKPVLVMRQNTERPEAVEAGTARLVGTDPGLIVDSTNKLLTDPKAYNQMANAVNPYGDGHASQRVVAALKELFGIGQRMPDFVV